MTELVPIALVDRWRQHYSRSTTWQQAHRLRNFLRHLHAIGGPDLTAAIPKLRRGSPRTETFTREALHRLIAQAEPWLRCFILLCTQLGLRFSNAVSISPANYNAENHTITLREKGDRARTIATTPEIESLFTTAPQTENPETPFIVSLRGKTYNDSGQVSETTIRDHWNALKRRAGVRANLNPHDLRRTAANLLYTETKDIRAVQHFLGHADLRSTAWYLAPFDPHELPPLLAQLRLATETKQ